MKLLVAQMRRLIVLVLFLSLLAGCTSGEKNVSSPFPGEGFVEVPSVVGQTSDYAAGYLSVANLELVVQDNTAGEAILVNQIPVEGSWVPVGSQIWAEVAGSTPTTTTVPTTTTPTTTNTGPTIVASRTKYHR